jgi:hypothetical protein
MGLSRSLLRTNRAPFHGIVPGVVTTPIGRISLSITFETRENFRTENIQFKVADFETAYNAFLGSPALTKFMAIPHYNYLVLKMPGHRGVISIRGDVKRAYDYDKERCETANRLAASTDLQELKEALAECPPSQTRSCLTPRTPKLPYKKGHTQHADTIVYGGTFQGCSHRQHLGSQIETPARQIPLGK